MKVYVYLTRVMEGKGKLTTNRRPVYLTRMTEVKANQQQEACLFYRSNEEKAKLLTNRRLVYLTRVMEVKANQQIGCLII
jgi:hypothetical protein